MFPKQFKSKRYKFVNKNMSDIVISYDYFFIDRFLPALVLYPELNLFS